MEHERAMAEAEKPDIVYNINNTSVQQNSMMVNYQMGGGMAPYPGQYGGQYPTQPMMQPGGQMPYPQGQMQPGMTPGA